MPQIFLKGTSNFMIFFHIYNNKENKMGEKKWDKKEWILNIKKLLIYEMEKDFGYVQDVCADLETGTITSIIVPGSNRFLSMISSSNDIVIQWQNIKCIGEEVILVEI